MGTVYQALDPDIQRRVAIKVLHPHLLDSPQGPALRERFRREAQAAARCHHPNIITVFDLSQDKGTSFIVTELVEGEELRGFLESGTRFARQEIGLIIGSVLNGLGAAHAQNIVHRDIKPSNILLLDDGSVKIADFGVARLEDSDLTLAGFMVGTPGYMSPEALRGEVVDQRSDLYSTGVILLELLTGKRANLNPLNERDFDEQLKILIAEIQPPIDPSLQAVLNQALAPDPERRFATASDFSASLNQAMGLMNLINEPLGTTLAETLTVCRTWILESENRPQQAQFLPDLQPTTSKSDRLLASKRSSLIHNKSKQPGWHPETLHRLEQDLATWLGPMTPHIIKRAASQHTSFGALIAELSQAVGNPEEKALFIRRAHQSLAQDSSQSGSATSRTSLDQPGLSQLGPSVHAAPITEDERARITAALAKFLGPLATTLITHCIPKAASRNELEQLLAANIPNSQDRLAFFDALKQRP
jgi:serine/threonine-protein kinase